MRKICFVLTAEFAVKAFMRKHIEMLSNDFEVTVIVNTKNHNLLQNLGLNAKLIPVNIAREISPIADFFCLLKLIWIFFNHRYDAIHSITPKAGLLAMLAAWLTMTKNRIHTFQGEVWITKKGLLRWLLISLDKLVAKIATQLIVVSKSERDFLVAQKIIKIEKSIVFNNGSISGVDTKKFKPDKIHRYKMRNNLGLKDDDVLCLFIGRLNRDKGILDLIEAFKLINNPKLHLMIVGPDEHDLIKLIQSSLIANIDRLHIFPETLNPENYMVASDILCLPSYREGFGVVIIEAAACGLTSLASRIYGITDAIIENETGLLHEVKNILDIRKNLELLFNDKKLREILSENALKRAVADFDSDLITAAWLVFYKRLLLKNV